jgi:hypothetical protein
VHGFVGVGAEEEIDGILAARVEKVVLDTARDGFDAVEHLASGGALALERNVAFQRTRTGVADGDGVAALDPEFAARFDEALFEAFEVDVCWGTVGRVNSESQGDELGVKDLEGKGHLDDVGTIKAVETVCAEDTGLHARDTGVVASTAYFGVAEAQRKRAGGRGEMLEILGVVVARVIVIVKVDHRQGGVVVGAPLLHLAVVAVGELLFGDVHREQVDSDNVVVEADEALKMAVECGFGGLVGASEADFVAAKLRPK